MSFEIGVLELGVREASGWARDTVREGVAGGNKLEIHISGYITGEQGCGMLSRSSCFSSSIEDGAKIGDRYAAVAERHLAVSEQGVVLDLIGEESVHFYQVTSEISAGISWDDKSVQLSIKMPIVFFRQKPEGYFRFVDKGESLRQTVRGEDLSKDCSDVIKDSVFGQPLTLSLDQSCHLGRHRVGNWKSVRGNDEATRSPNSGHSDPAVRDHRWIRIPIHLAQCTIVELSPGRNGKREGAESGHGHNRCKKSQDRSKKLAWSFFSTRLPALNQIDQPLGPTAWQDGTGNIKLRRRTG